MIHHSPTGNGPVAIPSSYDAAAHLVLQRYHAVRPVSGLFSSGRRACLGVVGFPVTSLPGPVSWVGRGFYLAFRPFGVTPFCFLRYDIIGIGLMRSSCSEPWRAEPARSPLSYHVDAGLYMFATSPSSSFHSLLSLSSSLQLHPFLARFASTAASPFSCSVRFLQVIPSRSGQLSRRLFHARCSYMQMSVILVSCPCCCSCYCLVGPCYASSFVRCLHYPRWSLSFFF